MTVWTRIAAARLRAASVLAAARVRADTTAAFRAATARASALLRPAADSIRDGSPRWRAAVRPAVDELLQRPGDLLRRTRPALADFVALLRRRGTQADEVVLHRPVAGEPDDHARPWATFLRRLARRSRRAETGGSRRPLASDPYGDELLDDDRAEDDDDRGALARLYIAIRRLRATRGWKRVEDVILDLDRLKTIFRLFTNGGRTPQPLPRRLPILRRPRTVHPPRRTSSAPLLDGADVQAAEWLVIASIPRIEVQMPAGIEVVFWAAPPPAPSTLAVADQLSGAFTSTDEPYPCVSAVADHGHILLLHARPEPEDGADDSVYYICDISSGSATLLPPPEALGGVLLPDRLAIVSHGEADYSVFSLQPGEATIHCYQSRTSEWIAFPVAVDGVIDGGGGGHDWEGHGVVAQGRTIVWFDLRVGFLRWELDGEDVLRFLPLPPGRARPPGAVGLDKHRCATLYQGQLRYADIVDARHRPLIQAWIFYDDAWVLEGSASFDRVWKDPLYTSTGLPREVPAVALIGPHGIVYLVIDSHMYGIDVRRGCVVADASFEVEAPPPEFHCSRFFRGWQFVE